MLIGRSRGGPVWLQSFSPWTPSQLDDVIDWLPLNAGAGATQEELTNYISGAAAIYRGSDGTIEPTDPTWTADGLSFDGGDYCNQPDNYNMIATSELSVMVAVNPTATGVHQALFTRENLGSTTPVILFRIYSNVSGLPHLLVRDDAGNNGAVTGTHVTVGDWITHGFTLQIGGTAKTYVNGLFDNSASLATVGNITLGRQALGAWITAGGGYFLTCSMAYVVVTGSELSATEMANLHNYIRRQVARRGITLPKV